MLVPDCPDRLMTSPGLMERSMSSTKPLTKLAAMDCRPKPKPKPMAPVSTVSAVRSTPAAFRPMRMLKADQKGIGEFRDADAGRERDVAQSLDAPFHPAADPGRDQHEQRQREQQLEHRPDRDAALAGGDADAVQGGDDGIEPAEVFGGNRQPDEQRDARFPVLHPGLVAEARGEQEHARLRTTM